MTINLYIYANKLWILVVFISGTSLLFYTEHFVMLHLSIAFEIRERFWHISTTLSSASLKRKYKKNISIPKKEEEIASFMTLSS